MNNDNWELTWSNYNTVAAPIPPEIHTDLWALFLWMEMEERNKRTISFIRNVQPFNAEQMAAMNNDDEKKFGRKKTENEEHSLMKWVGSGFCIHLVCNLIWLHRTQCHWRLMAPVEPISSFARIWHCRKSKRNNFATSWISWFAKQLHWHQQMNEIRAWTNHISCGQLLCVAWRYPYMSECIESRAQLNSFCWHDMFQVNYSRIFIWTFHNIFCFPSLGCYSKAGHKGYIIRNVYAVYVHCIYETTSTGYMPIWSLQFNIVIATSSLSYFNYVLFISERLLMHHSYTAHTHTIDHTPSFCGNTSVMTYIRPMGVRTYSAGEKSRCGKSN